MFRPLTVTTATEQPSYGIPPSKPVAHLTGKNSISLTARNIMFQLLPRCIIKYILLFTVWCLHFILLEWLHLFLYFSDGQDVAHAKNKMAWSMNADPLLYEMTYKDRELKIQKEGYYYVYSKVFFSDSNGFQHRISMHTDRYSGNITLLQSRKYPSHSKVSQKTQSNSYLGGVFHLYKDDGIFVDVSDTAKIVRHKPSENVFGAYMI